MASTVLPLDIIDAIIGELHDDVPALRACSTVSYSFLAPSRRRLFSAVALADRSGCERLFSILSRNRCIIPYIRKLVIHGAMWTARTKSFAPLLQLLADAATALKEVELSVHLEKYIYWADVPLNRARAFVNVLRSPSVESISLFGAFVSSFPVQIFSVSSGLKHITFFGGGPAFPDELERADKLFEPKPCFEPRELESLMIGGAHARRLVAFVTAPHSQVRVTHLHDLSIYDPEHKCIDAVWDVMYASRDALSSVVFDHRHDLQNAEYGPIDLHTLSHLQSLTFKLPFLTVAAGSQLDWLANSGLPPSLETLGINIEHDFFRLFDKGPNSREFSGVANMDERLASIVSDKHAHVKCVDIEFRLWVSYRRYGLDDDGEAQIGNVGERIKELLPRLGATGKLALKTTVLR
ncbi:hypothetical protein LshimejAT787_1901040 [Lyophyllum shimeji]|uniref:Uncharacterized protein n=1 Tax=Lyophyllum shimeji TaxID=47721 RepID=A0A9P3UWE9_LYOSH|nr:hypothetical protein LshimejAT787_1901040 [Lyophyllum shimeji]